MNCWTLRVSPWKYCYMNQFFYIGWYFIRFPAWECSWAILRLGHESCWFLFDTLHCHTGVCVCMCACMRSLRNWPSNTWRFKMSPSVHSSLRTYWSFFLPLHQPGNSSFCRQEDPGTLLLPPFELWYFNSFLCSLASLSATWDRDTCSNGPTGDVVRNRWVRGASLRRRKAGSCKAACYAEWCAQTCLHCEITQDLWELLLGWCLWTSTPFWVPLILVL